MNAQTREQLLPERCPFLVTGCMCLLSSMPFPGTGEVKPSLRSQDGSIYQLTTKYSSFSKIEIYVFLTVKKSEEYTVPSWYGLWVHQRPSLVYLFHYFQYVVHNFKIHLKCQDAKTVAIASILQGAQEGGGGEGKQERKKSSQDFTYITLSKIYDHNWYKSLKTVIFKCMHALLS